MEISQNSTTPAESFISKFEADRFTLNKFSRWIDERGRSRILIGLYHGGDPEYPGDPRIRRIGVDLLIVNEERPEYYKINEFINLVKAGKFQPWKGKPKAPTIEKDDDDIQFKSNF